ncbi:hypothetical protein SeMB42_g02262 [Synchytrium endobioticum]|uniref:Reverse transcriptase domain-containing protein n=1 Tax=Synchytrium endobioticum TaxID=286115 RepID=A0A507CG25_9FUNG|nr:hypothetical protein SeLEV6574_g06833 [Synchytrium endobioticum]TPX50387.1 hypothetical protein SeMB42_g02262 [Synchytrium endobioticum]
MRKHNLQWSELGEKCTKWYVDKIRPAVMKNTVIKGLKDTSGKVLTEPEAIQNHARKYYKALFSNEETDPEIQEEILESTLKNMKTLQISKADQKLLEDPIGESEIKNALKQLKNGKAPGPDGITTEFYKKFPDIVKNSCYRSLTGS